MTNKRAQSIQEEIINASLHGMGLGLAIAALAILVFLAATRADVWHITGFSIYGATLIILYLSSTLYHAFLPGKWKDRFHVVDHISIFLLIAGTYTPVTITALRGPWGWTIFGIVWGIAFFGILLKIFWFDKLKYFSVILYAVMGWIIIIAIKPLVMNVNTTSLIFLLLGGISYTVGIIFYSWRSLRFGHGIWHLLVLAGSIFHFFTMFFLVV